MSYVFVDFVCDGVDVVICYGFGCYIGFCSEWLLMVEIVVFVLFDFVVWFGMLVMLVEFVGWL